MARSPAVTKAWVNLDSAPWPKPARGAEHSKQAPDLEKTQVTGQLWVYAGETTLRAVLLCLCAATLSMRGFADLGSTGTKRVFFMDGSVKTTVSSNL